MSHARETEAAAMAVKALENLILLLAVYRVLARSTWNEIVDRGLDLLGEYIHFFFYMLITLLQLERANYVQTMFA